MSKRVAVSFENDYIKVVYADVHHENIAIDKTLTFTHREFDDFLFTTKDDEFIVVYDFQNIQQDVVSLPPAQPKYLRTLVELEIRKRVPELNEFSFLYEELRDVQKEGKKSKDVFFFAIAKEEIDILLQRFANAEKTITHLYPDVLPLSRFLQVEDANEDQSVLSVIDLGTSKTMFLMGGHKLNFVRVTPSEKKGFNSTDMENINMTVAYCRQVLRSSPAFVMLSNSSEYNAETVSPIIPVVQSKYPATGIPDDTVSQYVIPIAAIMFAGKLEDSNLLPVFYQGIGVQRKIMTYAIGIFLLLSVFGLGYSALNIADIVKTKVNISRTRHSIAENISVIDEYEKTASQLHKKFALMNFMNMANSSVDMQKALLSLQMFANNTVDLRTVNLKGGQDNASLQIEGAILFHNFRELRSNYETLVNQIRNSSQLKLAEESLDLKTGKFRIDLQWEK